VADADLAGFLEAAGRSLADAQGALTGIEAGVPQAMAISEADLEVKAAIAREPGGIRLEPISTADILRGGIEAGLLSTVRIHYVAVAPETLTAAGAEPSRTAVDVIGEVKVRPDLVALDRILEGLRYDAVFLPQTTRWLVVARDADARVVREVLVSDEPRRG
jgi:hypothetical protein